MRWFGRIALPARLIPSGQSGYIMGFPSGRMGPMEAERGLRDDRHARHSAG